jgi:hypothetical protein
MNENEAEIIDLATATLELVTGAGANIASQQWSGGSWCDVYEYKGRYFAVDEGGLAECGSAADAFIQAGIGRDTYDKISHVSISPDYRHLVEE